MRFDKRFLVLRKYREYYHIDEQTRFYIAKAGAPEELVEAINGLNAAIEKERKEGIHVY